MPAQRDEPSAPPQAEDDDTPARIEIALRAIGRLVSADRRGMSLPYGEVG